jgi:hypothetical protein
MKITIQWLPGLLEGSVLQTSRRGLSGNVSALKKKCRGSLCRREQIGRFLSYSSITEIENDVSIAVDFDQVLEFRICDDGDSLRKCGAELQIQANGSLSREIHVIVLSEIRSQIVGVKGVAVGEVGPTEAVTLVSIYLVRAPEQSGVHRHVTAGGKVEFQRFQTVQLSVQIDADFRE